MPIDKPEDYKIKDDYLLDGEMIAVEVRVEKPWWRILKVMSRKSSGGFLCHTEDDRKVLVNPKKECVYRKPWADEQIRHLFVKHDLAAMGASLMTKKERILLSALKIKNSKIPRREWTIGDHRWL